MPPSAAHFAIDPETAVQKFLVDMRLTAERSFRAWSTALEAGLSSINLPPCDVIKPHPLDHYFDAGLIALQASAMRSSFPPAVAEALLRQIALQVDATVGRSDRIISNMVFIILGRIRKNAALGLNVRADEVAIDVLLERLAIDRMQTTKHLMQCSFFRRALIAPLSDHVVWWEAFSALYSVRVPPPLPVRDAHFVAQQTYLTRRTPASTLFERGAFAAPPSPPPPSLVARLGQWLAQRSHTH
jgi:hypothetical protein